MLTPKIATCNFMGISENYRGHPRLQLGSASHYIVKFQHAAEAVIPIYTKEDVRTYAARVDLYKKCTFLDGNDLVFQHLMLAILLIKYIKLQN